MTPQPKPHDAPPAWGALVGFLLCLVSGVVFMFGLYWFFEFAQRFLGGLAR